MGCPDTVGHVVCYILVILLLCIVLLNNFPRIHFYLSGPHSHAFTLKSLVIS
uniref:Uncharacterized protein n=1 Tax=Anguilla anguilla TaxID=7936 RepID=A0A0E9WPK5_ANGAN